MENQAWFILFAVFVGICAVALCIQAGMLIGILTIGEGDRGAGEARSSPGGIHAAESGGAGGQFHRRLLK